VQAGSAANARLSETAATSGMGATVLEPLMERGINM